MVGTLLDLQQVLKRYLLTGPIEAVGHFSLYFPKDYTSGF